MVQGIRSRVWCVLVVVTLLAGSACAGPPGQEGADGDQVRLVKASRSLSTLPLLYALERGYFRDASLQIVELPDSTTSTAPIQAMLAGQADIVQVGATAVFAAQAAGQPVMGIGVPTPGPSYQIILSARATGELAAGGVSPQSPIAERVKALRGKTLATPGSGSTIDSLLRATLSEYGLAPDSDVTIRPISDPKAMVAALRQGQIDGFSFAPPFTSSTVADGTARLWIDYIRGDVPRFTKMPAGALVTTADFGQRHPESVKKFLTALKRAYADLAADPDGVRDFMAGTEYFRETNRDLFAVGFDAYRPAYALGPVPSEEGFAALRDVYNGDPSIKAKSSAVFDQIFDLSYLEVR
jgi:NitT/TauT family transport system substrate-binding protein